MLGAIIGDIVGSRFEFNNHRSKDFELFTEGCFATDDSIMTLAVAKAILETEKAIECGAGLFESDCGFNRLLSRLTVKYMQAIGRQYPDCGYGGMFGQWIFSDNPQPYHSFGNGAAMRISPVGFFARDVFEIASLSQTVTAVTHDHKEGLKGAEAAALAVYLARAGSLKEEIKQAIERDYYRLNFSIDKIRESYQFNETCQKTVPQAIQCFLESKSFEDAIRIAISLGGDSDTIAAITGAIAEAYYGIPDEIRQQALRYLDDDLLSIYNEWEARAGSDHQGRFRALTKYIGRFTGSDPYGYWVMDEEGDGSPEKPFHFPWVNYSLPVSLFIVEANQFALNHPEIEPYTDVLAHHGIKWDHDAMCRAKIENLNEACLAALITGSVRAEKFCDGAFLRFLEDGCVQKWLKALRDSDCSRVKKRVLAELHFLIGGFGLPNHYHLIFANNRSYFMSEDVHLDAPKQYETFSPKATRDIREAWNNLHTEYWRYSYPQEGENLICDGTQWALHVRYEDSFWIAYHGDNQFPENWFELLDLFRINHDDDNGGGDKEKGKRKPDDVIYCKVSFCKGGDAYSYLTEDESLSVGDKVVVPVGDDKTERIGYVDAINYYLPEEVPYPLDKVKKIIRRFV